MELSWRRLYGRIRYILLAGESAKGDISRLYQENTLPSGEQLMDVYVNNTWKGQFTVQVGEHNNSLSFQPEDINKLGLNLSDNAKKLSAETTGSGK